MGLHIGLLAHFSLMLAAAVIPMWRFFFFLLQTLLTRYLHPFLIYAIKGINSGLFNSFIYSSVSLWHFFLFFKLIYIYRFLPEPTDLFLSIRPQWQANTFSHFIPCVPGVRLWDCYSTSTSLRNRFLELALHQLDIRVTTSEKVLITITKYLMFTLRHLAYAAVPWPCCVTMFH